ncbi:hypothetical protein FNV62_55000 [Streptomyces sp. RLB3-17]|uniref:DUF4760 domain-containing protein n=1 Tax=Streptomyces sp. RLB3-17 TaxID=2594455 RepID=UPI001165A264|nr:hypothetical protein [Streptomyces sp. RLB3-17]QDO45839.1 hypothetical protein FNV62_55000 [Streptomyces sp. RLB3-17]
MLLNIFAIGLSVLAFASSTYLAFVQATLMRRANYLPAYVDSIAVFRSAAFHDHHAFVTESLLREFDPQRGISGLPGEAREAVYDIAYFYQNFALLRLAGILDEEAVAFVHQRVIKVWEALAPFVERERELMGTTEIYFMRVLEEFAADARDMAPETVNALLSRHRKRRRRLKRGLARQTARYVNQARRPPEG